MKKFISLLIVLTVILSIAGCGAKGDDKAVEGNATTFILAKETAAGSKEELVEESKEELIEETTAEPEKEIAETPAEDFKYYINSKGIEIDRYIGNDKVVRIPAKINDLPVVEISSGVFSDCASLEKIIIPDSVTVIGEYAFEGCSRLKEITIPDSVTEIGGRVFGDCISLEKIIIPDGVTEIRFGVFSGCTSLEKITFSKGVTSIERSAFSGCTSLKEITIPDSVTEIEPGVFSGCASLEEIIIPDSVTAIKGYAFEGCKGLKEITLPDSVTYIGYGAFEDCDNLTVIYKGEEFVGDTTDIYLTVDTNVVPEITAEKKVYKEYTIEKGENLLYISKKCYGDSSMVKEIMKLNEIEDMDKIYAGQIIKLP